MSDTTETRATVGTAANRRPSVASTAAYGLGVGFLVAVVHWLGKCASHGWFLPDDGILEIAAGAMLPVLHTVGRIINNLLARAERESA